MKIYMTLSSYVRFTFSWNLNIQKNSCGLFSRLQILKVIDFTKIAKNTITLLANRNISYISCLVDMFFTLWLLVQIHKLKH